MPVFFSLQINHKKFDLMDSEVFIFNKLDDFLYYAEYFYLRQNYWNINIHTNTKNINDYISFLNVDIKRFLIEPQPFFITTDDVDFFYEKNKNSLIIPISSLYEKIYNYGTNLYYDNYTVDENFPHVLYLNDEEYPFSTIKEYEKLETKFKDINIPFRLFINPFIIELNDYLYLVNKFDVDFKKPSFITNSYDLFLYFNSLEDINPLFEFD